MSYSFSWGYKVLEAFRERYGRATDIVEKLFGIDDNWLVHCVCGDQVRWERFKKTVKYVDRRIERGLRNMRALKQQIEWQLGPVYDDVIGRKHLTRGRSLHTL